MTSDKLTCQRKRMCSLHKFVSPYFKHLVQVLGGEDQRSIKGCAQRVMGRISGVCCLGSTLYGTHNNERKTR